MFGNNLTEDHLTHTASSSTVSYNRSETSVPNSVPNVCSSFDHHFPSPTLLTAKMDKINVSRSLVTKIQLNSATYMICYMVSPFVKQLFAAVPFYDYSKRICLTVLPGGRKMCRKILIFFFWRM